MKKLSKNWVLLGVALLLVALSVYFSRMVAHSAYRADFLVASNDISLKDFKLVASIKLPSSMPTYHPQGMLKFKDRLFVSTFDSQQERAFLLEYKLGYEEKTPSTLSFSRGRELTLEDSKAHPSGLDYDPVNEVIWTSLAQAKPGSKSTLVRVDPYTFEVQKAAEFSDHIGALAVFNEVNQIQAFNWDSKQMYKVSFEDAFKARELSAVAMGADLLAYQDCKSIGRGLAICSGYEKLPAEFFGMPLPLVKTKRGFIHLIRFDAEFTKAQVLASVAVPYVKADGTPCPDEGIALTTNPMDIEWLPAKNGSSERLRFYFVPHDHPDSTLLIFDADLSVPLESALVWSKLSERRYLR